MYNPEIQTEMSLTLQEQQSSLNYITLYEPIDTAVLEKLINSKLLLTTFNNKIAGAIHQNEKQQLIEYRRLITKGLAKVKYSKKQGMKYGRCNPKKGLGLYNIRRQLRHTLAKTSLKDIDVDNCHPVILQQILVKNNIPCPLLTAYVNERKTYIQTVMEHYSVDRDSAKVLFIRLLYSGGITNWRKDFKIPETVVDLPFIVEFKREFNTITTVIANNNPDIVKAVQKQKAQQGKKDYNLNGSTCSYFLQEYECRLLETVFIYCVENGYVKDNVCVLCADGLMIESIYYTPALLTELSQLIKQTFDFDVSFSNKDMDTDFLGILDDNLNDDYALQLKAINDTEQAKKIEKEAKEQAKVKKNEMKQQKEQEKEEMKQQKEQEKEEREQAKEEREQAKEEREQEMKFEKLRKEQERKQEKEEKARIEIEKKLLKDKLEKEKADLASKNRTDNRFIGDDNACANLIIDDLKDILVSYNRRVYLKRNNVWNYDVAIITEYLKNFIMNSTIYRENKNSDLLPYGQNINTAKNVCEAILIKIKEQPCDFNIYEKFHTTTKGRLCFKDGVLDFKVKRFFKWDEIDFEYYTTVMINYELGDYITNPNMEIVELIQSKIYENLYGGNLSNALQFLSRGITGHSEDKNWATYLGNRDCGKGIQYESLKNAFEDYVKTFELGNILYGRSTNTEEVSRKLYWTLDLEFARLAISQETPAPADKLKVNGKLIKKLAGGGDELVARKNFDREDTHFKIDTTFMMMGNNTLVVDTADAMEHCLEFSSVCQFKTQVEIDEMKNSGESELIWGIYKVKDPSVKSSCCMDEWKKAVVYLLFSNYSNQAVPIHRNNDENTDGNLRRKILEFYEITHKMEDVVLVADACDVLADEKGKITREFESLGVPKGKSKNRDDTRDKQCYKGIKLKIVPVFDADGNPIY